MFARFWWVQQTILRKFTGWSGLNFRDLEGFNQAPVAKQVWRILRNSNLLVSKVLKAKYFDDSSVIHATSIRNQSYFWQGFLWGRDLLVKGLRLRIGSGSNINAFNGPWLPRPTTSRLITASNELKDIWVSNFINSRGEWNSTIVSNFFREEDRDVILSTPISPYHLNDPWL